MDFSTFRNHLRQLIDSRGYTIKQISEELNIPSATISRYLSGLRTPDLAYIVKISIYFSVSIDWLVGINGDHLEVFPKEIQNMAELYQLASPDDRLVVKAVLNKYSKEK